MANGNSSDRRSDRFNPADIERFEAKIDRSGECHRWTGAHSVNGYGRFWYAGRARLAHGVALLFAGIDIPKGMTVDHVWARGCLHKDCVRIDHLEVVTRRENIMRSNVPAAINARMTHCKRGHELTPENTRRYDRTCLTCIRAYRAARRAAA